MLKSWLRLFRAVNLPTVPGDVLCGVAAVVAGGSVTSVRGFDVLGAVVASVFLYLFGLVDNDIVGAAKDGPERPIPAGEISLRSARFVRLLVLLFAAIAGGAFGLRPAWWVAAAFLLLAIVVYNRSAFALAMGLCRGFNVLCGAAAVGGGASFAGWLDRSGGLGAFRSPTDDFSVVVAIVFTAYITLVTKYSEGEERDPARRATVGLLIGALVYLQLLTLLAAYLYAPGAITRASLLAGAALLIALRIMKRALPGVSAS